MAPGELRQEPAAPGNGDPLALARSADGGPAPSATATARRGRRVGLAAAALALTAAGLGGYTLWRGQEDLTGQGVYHGTGMVLAVLPAPSQLDAERPVGILQHDPIPELMDKRMTHPFLVRSQRLLRGIAPGTRVRFTLKDTPGALLVVRLTVIP